MKAASGPEHTLATRHTMKASDYVASFLHAQGVTYLFEVVGGMITLRRPVKIIDPGMEIVRRAGGFVVEHGRSGVDQGEVRAAT
jgi:hypothetical protein